MNRRVYRAAANNVSDGASPCGGMIVTFRHMGVAAAEGGASLDNSQYRSLLQLRICTGSRGSRYLIVICDSINMTLIRQKLYYRY